MSIFNRADLQTKSFPSVAKGQHLWWMMARSSICPKIAIFHWETRISAQLPLRYCTSLGMGSQVPYAFCSAWPPGTLYGMHPLKQNWQNWTGNKFCGPLVGKYFERTYIYGNHIRTLRNWSLFIVLVGPIFTLFEAEKNFLLANFGEIKLFAIIWLQHLIYSKLCWPLFWMPALIQLCDEPMLTR